MYVAQKLSIFDQKPIRLDCGHFGNLPPNLPSPRRCPEIIWQLLGYGLRIFRRSPGRHQAIVKKTTNYQPLSNSVYFYLITTRKNHL